MARSPYRSAPKAELVVAGGPHPLVFWLSIVAFAALFTLPSFESMLPLWGLAALVVAVAVPAAIFTARRNRWRFRLEREKLTVERLLAGRAKLLGVLDVSGGARLHVQVPEQGTGLDARLSLTAGGDEIAFFPGADTRRVHSELARMLREHQVELDAPELPPLPSDKLGLPR